MTLPQNLRYLWQRYDKALDLVMAESCDRAIPNADIERLIRDKLLEMRTDSK